MQRLKSRAQFQAVMSGSTVSRSAHFVLHRLPLDTPDAAPSPGAGSRSETSTGPGSERPQALFAVRDVWMGALVPKRWAKRAVTRNTIKRQIYAVSASFESRLPVAAHVVRLRAGFDRQQFISASSPQLKLAVHGELEQLFARAAA
ncbi:MAG: ribonuclease P protein component [Ramlibacter sp.]|nr:ribonuclease P protein component [Ramlibacter sp.]